MRLDTIGHEFLLARKVAGPGTGHAGGAPVMRADAEQATMDVPVLQPAAAAISCSSDPAVGVRTIDPSERDG